MAARHDVVKVGQFVAPATATFGALESFDRGHLFLGIALTIYVAFWVLMQMFAMAVNMKDDYGRLRRE